MPQIHRPPETKNPEDAPIICSICGYPTKKEDIGIAGDMAFVRMRDARIGRWAVWICNSCLQNTEEIERGGEALAILKAGRAGTEHI